LDIVKALNPVQFTWKQHPIHNFDRSCPTVGFIAQEVQQVLADKPYLNSIIKKNECEIEPAQYETVVLNPAVDEVKDDEGNIIVEAKEAVTEQRLLKEAVKEDFYGIAEGNMIAILTKALQESTARIEQLEAKVAALEGTQP
jgi:predicted RNase H-like nuclease (RuvC/YqgF family)